MGSERGRLIGPILVLWSWLRAGLGFGRERVAPSLDECEPAPKMRRAQSRGCHAQSRDHAQDQDHGDRSTRGPNSADLSHAQSRGLDPGSPRARLMGGPRIDGGTSWAIRAGPMGFRCWRELVGAAKRGAGSVEWPDPWGEVVVLALDRGSPGSGAFVLSTGRVRIEIRRRWAEVQITAEAAEVEGVESWYLREMPRATFWLLGAADCRGSEGSWVAEWVADLGVEQRRIEICLDVAGWQLAPGDERAMVSRSTIHTHWRSEDVLDGIDAGQRNATPNSLSVYDKIAKLASQRGPERAALLRRWDDYGRELDEPVTRIELRLAGKALRLLTEDGEQLDATHPGAALDGELLGLLWSDGLTRHWMADLSAGRSQVRDNPPMPIWTEARAAGGHVEAVRLRRDVAARQLEAIRRHALERLGRVGADVEQLLEGDGSGAAVIDALDSLISSPGWDRDLARARARFADLLEQARGAE